MMTENAYVRAHQRIPVTGSGVLTWDAGNGARRCPTQVRNLGDGGLQLFVTRAMVRGWTAYVTGETFECVGDVRYCVPSDGGFLVGLSFRHEPYLRSNGKTPS